MPVDPSLIGGALGLISNLATSYMNQRNVENTNVANRDAVERQNQLNMEQWQRENAYNAPINQIQRLRAAGLNPGIMYGSGGVVNSSAPSPTMQSSRDVPPQSTFNVDPLTVAQIANLNAQTHKTDEEAESERVFRQSRLDNLNAATSNLLKQNDDISSKIEQRIKENALTDEQINSLSFGRLMESKRYGLDRQRLKNESRMTDAQIDKLSADTQKALAEAKVTNREYDEMIYTFAIRKAGLQAQVNLSNAQVQQAYATARKLGFEADAIEGLAGQKQWEAAAMRGEHGQLNQIGASIKYAVQEALHDVGGIVGIFK